MKTPDAEEHKDEDTNAIDLTPPNTLLSFPVVAGLVNGLLSSFNELRNCASYVVGLSLSPVLERFLDTIAQALVAYRKGRPEEVLKETQLRYNEMCVLFATTFLPYVSRCYNVVFGIHSSPDLAKRRLTSLLNILPIQERINQLPIYPKQQVKPEAEEEDADEHQDTEGASENEEDMENASQEPQKDDNSPEE